MNCINMPNVYVTGNQVQNIIEIKVYRSTVDLSKSKQSYTANLIQQDIVTITTKQIRNRIGWVFKLINKFFKIFLLLPVIGDVHNLYIVILAEILNIKVQKRDVELPTIDIQLLCKGKLVKAWGLGGEFNPHSKELNTLLKRVCNKS